jgi:penicillin-binding protein 2
MVRRSTNDNLLVEGRFFLVSWIIFAIVALLSLRLWYIQIYKGDYYTKISKRNRIRRIEIPAARGSIYDRHGNTVLTNRPFHDLVFIPQYVTDKDTTLKVISRLLNIPVHNLETKLKKGRGRPKFLPIALKRNLTLHEVSIIESSKALLPGIEINSVPRRDYSTLPAAHLVGHLGELRLEHLEKIKENDPETKYIVGDLIGKQGLELKWENELRGIRGVKLIQVDAFGRKTASISDDWQLPSSPAVPGKDIYLTLDAELQKITEEAFKGKNGSVVVLNTNSGEILSMVSYPDYPADLFQKGISSEKWRALMNDPFKPLYDKSTGGEYQPGSIYKPVVALAALQEGIVNAKTTFNCTGKFELGGDVFHCHNRAGHGIVNLDKALMKSCNVYFYHLGVELGVDRIAKYAKSLGLGSKLGVNINYERPGLIPTTAWKKLTYRRSWRMGDTPSISVGQGANLLTPFQMASLYSTISNSGKIWKPYIVKKVVNHFGETLSETNPDLIENVSGIAERHFATIRRSLTKVVMDSDGTGHKAKVEGQTVAGKTGSVQVVSLKKNRNQTDVSVKWREHAIFAAFSPVVNSEVAIAIVSQNDEVGGGGKSAAPIAKVILEGYYDLKRKREALGKASSKNTSEVKVENGKL